MTKREEEALKWAIEKFWNTKTDDEIAIGLKVSTEEVIQMRHEMGLKGKESLKDYARRYLLEMTEPQKKEFMSKLSPELIFKMAEGNPATTGTLEINTEPIKIDITHQLLKVYGDRRLDGNGPVTVLGNSEVRELPA